MYQINEFGIGLSLEPDKKCIPEDCWCSYYDNPYDNYYHTHYLTPAQKYFFWVQE